MNNSSSFPTGISKHSKTMDKNTHASRSCIFYHYFLVFGYPGETLALVVHILHHSNIYEGYKKKITNYKWVKGLKTNCLQNKQNWKNLVKKLNKKYMTYFDFVFIFPMTIPQVYSNKKV